MQGYIKGTWLEPVLWWGYTAVAVTALCAAVYIAVQQDYRQTLNDPQIQLAEDGAARLGAGGVPADVINRNQPPIDIKSSLDAWVAVYDQSGMPLESEATLNNAPAQPPKGLFDDSSWTDLKTFNTPAGKETRVSWQPEPDVRQAIVLVKAANGYYVVAGRSMRLVEERVGELGLHMLIGWAVTLAALLVASFVGWFLLGFKNR